MNGFYINLILISVFGLTCVELQKWEIAVYYYFAITGVNIQYLLVPKILRNFSLEPSAWIILPRHYNC